MANKEDDNSLLWVGYRILNTKIMPSPLPIPNIEDIFDDIKDCDSFKLVDMFSGYCQLKMAESWKQFTNFANRFGTYAF